MVNIQSSYGNCVLLKIRLEDALEENPHNQELLDALNVVTDFLQVRDYMNSTNAILFVNEQDTIRIYAGDSFTECGTLTESEARQINISEFLT